MQRAIGGMIPGRERMNWVRTGEIRSAAGGLDSWQERSQETRGAAEALDVGLTASAGTESRDCCGELKKRSQYKYSSRRTAQFSHSAFGD